MLVEDGGEAAASLVSGVNLSAVNFDLSVNQSRLVYKELHFLLFLFFLASVVVY